MAQLNLERDAGAVERVRDFRDEHKEVIGDRIAELRAKQSAADLWLSVVDAHFGGAGLRLATHASLGGDLKVGKLAAALHAVKVERHLGDFELVASRHRNLRVGLHRRALDVVAFGSTVFIASVDNLPRVFLLVRVCLCARTIYTIENFKV